MRKRLSHRREKLHEKMQSEIGMRMQNRWFREQVKWSKLPILVIKELPEWTDELADAWMNWAKMPGKIIYKPAQS